MSLSNQRKKELNRQRGYGEQPLDSPGETVTAEPAGFRASLHPDHEEADHGAFRDDGDVPQTPAGLDHGIERKALRLVDPEDLTGETFPETYNADIGAVSIAPSSDEARPAGSDYGELETDGFSIREKP